MFSFNHRIRRLLPAGLLLISLSLACNLTAQPAATPTVQPTIPASPTPAVSQAAPTLPPPAPTSTVGLPTAQPATGEPTEPLPTAGGENRMIQIYLIALEDNGASGEAVGCGDSLVPVQREIPASAEPARAALETLFSVDDQFYGESGLYNALYQSDLQVESLAIDAAGHAQVNLAGPYALGGVCDNPRFQAQIEATVLQFPEIQSASITIDGIPLEELLSGEGM